MAPCVLPGCLGTAIHGDVCAIHRDHLGTPCEWCKGKGARFYAGQGKTMACLYCGGTGLKDKSVSRRRKPERDDPVDARPLLKLAREDE